MNFPDDLIIGGGGSIAVGTTGMFEQAQRLEQLERELGQCVSRLAAIDRVVSLGLLTGADAPLSALRAEQAIDDASIRLGHAADLSGQLAANLRFSANLYGVTETVIAGYSRVLAAHVGIGLGFLASTVGLLMLPGFLAAISGPAAALALFTLANPAGALRLVGGVRAWLDSNKAVLSDPRLVELVRLSVMSVDDFGAGALRLPPQLIALLGDEGLGLVGLDTSAAVVVAVGGLGGALRETPVLTPTASSSAAAPARSFSDRASRIPTGESQLRVDRYVRAGKPDRFELYIGGTIDFAPTATDEPFDLTSNVSAMAGREAGSYRAVEQALAAAGVDAQSEVVVTGYSQGGLIGSMLAASGNYDVTGLYTLGAPAGQVPVPASVPWVAVEHTDDIVPAVGGTWGSADPVLVRREAFAERPVDPDFAFPAHQLSYYRETAALLDGSEETRLVDANARFGASRGGVDAGAGGAIDRVESTWYRSVRTG